MNCSQKIPWRCSTTKRSSKILMPSTNYVIGEVSFPKEYKKEVVNIVCEMLQSPTFYPRWAKRKKTEIAL
jgi:hypothetical protein